MTLVDKVLALKALEPFSSLEGAELFVIAGITKARVYQPGEKIFPGGKPFSHVYITVRGRAIFPDGSCAPEVLGVESLIGGEIFQRDVIAGTETECLLIPKEHFFTIMHECPALAAGFIGMIQRRKLGGARKA